MDEVETLGDGECLVELQGPLSPKAGNALEVMRIDLRTRHPELRAGGVKAKMARLTARYCS